MASWGKLEISPWSGLPTELLQLISGKVTDIIDYIQFRRVCTSWRFAATPANLPPQLPWLMLLFDPDSISRSFFRTSTQTVCSLNLPEARGHSILGSSNGWLVMVDGTTLDVSLLNPLTRARIQQQIPPLTLPGIWIGNLFLVLGCYAFMSPYPESARDCILAFIHASPGFIYCRLGDDAWTEVHTTLESIAALAYHEGKFYAIDTSRDVTVFNIIGSSEKAELIPSLKLSFDYWWPYLVEWAEDLLLVLSLSSAEDDFEIFKLDTNGELRWLKLEGIGDCTIFLVCSWLSSVASDVSGFRRNSICFAARTDDNEVCHINVFPIEVGMMELFPCHSPDLLHREWVACGRGLTWFTPSLC